MNYSEAIKVVKQYPEHIAILDGFRAHVMRCKEIGQYFAGSWQFSVDGECFFYSGECYFDELDGTYHTMFKGGKHTPLRSRQLLEEKRTWVIR